jgi:hypothetical protein
MAHSFKTISKALGGIGLIFEGLKRLCVGWDETFCQGFPGVNPQRSDQGDAQRNFFLDIVFQEQAITAWDRKFPYRAL